MTEIQRVPEPYKLKWLFCNWWGSEQAASACERAIGEQGTDAVCLCVCWELDAEEPNAICRGGREPLSVVYGCSHVFCMRKKHMCLRARRWKKRISRKPQRRSHSYSKYLRTTTFGFYLNQQTYSRLRPNSWMPFVSPNQQRQSTEGTPKIARLRAMKRFRFYIYGNSGKHIPVFSPLKSEMNCKWRCRPTL